MRVSERASRWIHRAVLPLLAGLLSMFAADLAIDHYPPLNRWEADMERRDASKRPVSVDPSLLCIVVTRETRARLHVDPSLDRMPRQYYARLLNGLDRAGASAALLDFIFDEDYLGTDALKAALRNLKSLRVTLATSYPEDGAGRAVQTDEGVRGAFTPSVVYEPKAMPRVALGSAFALKPQGSDVAEGAIAVQEGAPGAPALLHVALQAVLQKQGVVDRTPKRDFGDLTLSAGPLVWWLTHNMAVQVNWPQRLADIPKMELSDALRVLDGPDAGRRFGGKLVLVGVDNGTDTVDTDGFGRVAGVTFVAAMTNTLLQTDRSPSGYHDSHEFVADALAILIGAAAFSLGYCRRLVFALPGIAAMVGSILVVNRLFVDRDIDAGGAWIALSVALAGLLGLLASVSPLYREDHRPSGVREEATALFLDLRGSTRLLDGEGLETYRVVVGELLHHAKRVVSLHGGRVERTLGDGLLAVFRPGRGVHHALRASRTAEAIPHIAREIGERHGLHLAVGVGFETGIVTGGYVEEGGRRVWSSAGRSVTLAQRIQAASEGFATSVMVGPTAARLIEDECPVRRLGTMEAKGFAEPIEVFALVKGNVRSSAENGL